MAIPHISYDTRKVHPERRQAIIKHAGPTVLDVGCGNGAYVRELHGLFDIQGVDVKRFDAWSQSPGRFHTGEATALPFEEDSFDTVLCFELLEHLPDPLAALRECRRVCRKNIILTVPNCDVTPGMEDSHMIYSHWIDSTHVHFFDMPAIEELAHAAGFKTVERSHINAVSPAPLFLEFLGLYRGGFVSKMASRLLSSLLRKRYFLTCLVVAEKSPIVL